MRVPPDTGAVGEEGAGDPTSAGLAIEALDGISEAFCAIDRDWRVIYANIHACRRLAVERDTIVGRVLWQQFPQLSGSDAGRQLREAVAARRTVEYEAVSPIDQSRIRVRVSPLSHGIAGVYWRDAAEALSLGPSHSNEHLHLAMGAARLGTWELDMVTGERRWSDQARAVMGVPPEAEPSYEALIGAVHPEDRDRVAEAYRRSNDPEGTGEYYVEYRVGVGEEPRWVAARGRTVFDEKRRPLHMLGVTLDITEQKLREEALRESQERFRTMLEALPQIAFVIGIDGVAEYYNRRFELYIGHPVGTDLAARTALHHPEDQPTLTAARQYGVAGDREYTAEARLRRHDGVYRWHIIRNTPLKRDGKTVAWLGTAVDIDDLRQAQETLHRVNDELERRVADRTRDLAEANARLRAGEESHRALFWKAPVPMHALDALRCIINVNEHWLKLFGYTRDEVIGRSDRRLSCAERNLASRSAMAGAVAPG